MRGQRYAKVSAVANENHVFYLTQPNRILSYPKIREIERKAIKPA